MAVSVNCSICKKFIRDVEGKDLSKLTGREICDECNKKVKETIGIFDGAVNNYLKDLGEMQKEAKKSYSTLDNTYNTYVANAKDLQIRVRAELEALTKEVLSGRMQNMR